MKSPLALAAALAALAIVTAACSSQQAEDAANAQVDKEMIIKASNYTFDSSEYRVKAGETVRFILESSSGNHGIHIKEIGLKLDPNKNSQIVTPKEKGSYPFECTILCGPGHKDMTATLIVE